MTTSCRGDFDCHGGGQCHQGECLCYPLYGGNACAERWLDDADFERGFSGYIYSTATIYVLLLLFGVYILLRKFNRPDEQRRFTLLIAGLLCIASMLRVALFYLDPYVFLGHLPRYAERLLAGLPICIWVSVYCLIMLYLVALEEEFGLQPLKYRRLIRWGLVSLAALAGAIIPPLFVREAIDPRMPLVYNSLLTLDMLVLIPLSVVMGRRMWRRLHTRLLSYSARRSQRNSGAQLTLNAASPDLQGYLSAEDQRAEERAQFNKWAQLSERFFHRLTVFLFGMSAAAVCLFCGFVALALAGKTRYGWLISVWITRLCEMVMVVFLHLVILLHRPLQAELDRGGLQRANTLRFSVAGA